MFFKNGNMSLNEDFHFLNNEAGIDYFLKKKISF